MQLLFALIALGSAAKTIEPKLLKQSSKSTRDNGLDILFNQVDVNKNMVISPLSIIGCMYMLAAGAAGESREEILRALDFGKFLEDAKKVEKPFKAYKKMIDELSSVTNDGYTLDIANGMFFQEGMSEYSPGNKVNASYVDLLQKGFVKDVSNIQELNFSGDNQAATNTINEWVSAATKNKIPKLFKEPLDSDTLVILASTLYFKASWNQKFKILKEKEVAKDNLCWTTSSKALLADECQDVTWMRKEESVNIAKTVFRTETSMKPIEVIDIPLKNAKRSFNETNNKFMMQIWLPEKHITNATEDKSIRELIKKHIGTVRNQMRKVKSTIVMPKFSLEYNDDIVASLQALGINKVFSQFEADLSPMLGNEENAYVKKVNHAVKIDVDENGVEGAAVTTAQISSRTFSQPKLIQINRPFYFVISNRCWVSGSGKGTTCSYGNIPLFIGRVVNP